MKKDTISIIEGAICICSGVAFTDIVHSTIKNLPHGKGLVKGVGRLGLYAGTFVTGASMAAQAIKLGEGIFDVTKKSIDKVKDELEKQREEADTCDPEVEEVIETPSDDEYDISDNDYEE